MKLVELPINEIYPYENNPRNNDAAVDVIIKSIETLDFRKPLHVDENHVLLAGHTRLKALLKLGRTTAWCIIHDDLTEAQKKAYRIADNKIGELSSFDFDKLESEYASLQDSGLDLSWFDMEIVDLAEPIEFAEEEKEEKQKKEKEPAKSEKGKIYQLGRHYLFCGDGSTKEAWKRLFKENIKAACMITSFQNIAPQKQKSNEVFSSKSNRIFKLFRDFTSDNAAFYVFCNSNQKNTIFNNCNSNGMEIKSMLYQVKDKPTKGKSHYRIQAESCIFGGRKNIDIAWYGRDDSSNIFFFDDEKIKGAKGLAKSTELLNLFLQNSTLENDIVIDCFAENGSTIIACETIGRICMAAENNEYKCDFIRRRYAEYVNGDDFEWEEETKAV